MSNPLTTVSTTKQRDYEITKDPFAIFSFALLVTTILLFLFILLVTARRSSIEVWDSMRHGPQRYRRRPDLEHAQEAAVPLMSSDRTNRDAGRHTTGPGTSMGPSRALKRVRFSEHADSTTVPPASGAFDEVFDRYHEPNGGVHEARTAKRKSASESQFAELCLA